MKNTQKQYGVYLKILISDSSSIFNPDPKKLKYKYTLLETENIYLILKNDHKSLAKLNQYLLGNEENLIFIIKKKQENYILKYNSDNCVLVSLNKYYTHLTNLDFRLWKSILNYDNETIINEKNTYNYIFELNENDIIRLGNVKMILREFHISGTNIKNFNSDKITDIFTLKLKQEKNNDNNEKICSKCNKGYLGIDNPLIEFCYCKDDNKYRHYLCEKNYIKKEIKINDNNGCLSYSMKTHCSKCGKFSPLCFYIEEKREKSKIYKFYDLIDIPRNKDEDYLLFEALEYQDINNYYIKYFFYINLETNEIAKEKTLIMIGRDKDDMVKYNYDKLIKIEDNKTISNQHALIEYNKQSKKLRLRNLSEKLSTLVLKNFSYEFELKPDNHENLIFELGNIKIEAKLNSEDEFEEAKNEEKENKLKIEEKNFEFEDNK